MKPILITLLAVALSVFPALSFAQKPISRPTQSKKEKIINPAPSKKGNGKKKNRYSKTESLPVEKIESNKPDTLSATQKEIISGIMSNMVHLDAGSCLIGSKDKERYHDETPLHIEHVDAFSIGKYEVTQKEWKAIMGDNPSHFRGDDLPVENVTWYDCLEFINRLNSLSGKNFRLPSEIEWEYAARSGNTNEQYRYAAGNDIDEVAWYKDNSGKMTRPVATKRPNSLGLHDMCGNVAEWTGEHWSEDYRSPRNAESIVVRGGSWSNTPNDCRVARRNFYHPTNQYAYIGFRLAL